MRDENGDGLVDNEDIEVLDAFKVFKETMTITLSCWIIICRYGFYRIGKRDS